MIVELIIIFFAITFAGVFAAFIFTYINAHKLVVRDPMNKSRYINEYLMIEKADKQTKSRKWISVWWQPKYKCERPPAEAIDTRKRGKMHAECYLVAEGQHCWITDQGICIKQVQDEKGSKEWAIVDPNIMDEEGEPLKIDTFRPYTVTQRHSLISEHKKSIDISKNKGWTAERITQLASIGVLGMVVIVAIIFGGEFWQGLNEAQNKNLALTDKQIELTDKLGIIAQSIGVNIEGMETHVAQKPKPQSGNVIQTPSEEPPTNKTK